MGEKAAGNSFRPSVKWSFSFCLSHPLLLSCHSQSCSYVCCTSDLSLRQIPPPARWLKTTNISYFFLFHQFRSPVWAWLSWMVFCCLPLWSLKWLQTSRNLTRAGGFGTASLTRLGLTLYMVPLPGFFTWHQECSRKTKQVLQGLLRLHSRTSEYDLCHTYSSKSQVSLDTRDGEVQTLWPCFSYLICLWEPIPQFQICNFQYSNLCAHIAISSSKIELFKGRN